MRVFPFFFFLSFFAAQAQQSLTLYFESGQHRLQPSENARLSQWIASNPKSKVVAINGYTDEDGSSGFNDTLAQKRVLFVFSAISDKVLIREDFQTRSFGEAHRQSENKAENRRVEVYFLTEKELPRENEILGINEDTVVVPPKPKPHYPDKITIDNPDGTQSAYQLDKGFMEKVGQAKAGEKLKVDHLNFQLNTFAIVPESRAKLYELLLIMKLNPGLKIQVQGHLCCMSIDRNDLSTQRAKAVKGFLVANGIAASRVTFKGFGSSQALYPLPEKTEEERAANRRVEIEIVENP